MADPVIDSSVVIDYLRGRPGAVTYLNSIRASGALVTHSVAVAEVLSGARNRNELVAFDALFSMFQVVHIEDNDARVSIDLLRLYRLSHGIGWLDCLIASTCLRSGSPIATTNINHFSVVPNLQVIRPY